MKLILKGNVPSQKNSKQIFRNRATGKPFITSSVLVKQWQTNCLWQLKGIKPIEKYPVCVNLLFFYDSNRRHDLDNGAAGVMDILVKAGILEDDSTKYVQKLCLTYGGVDKNNPRVEIYILT